MAHIEFVGPDLRDGHGVSVMDILENELVKKYFGCHCPPMANVYGDIHQKNCSPEATAMRVIQAMQEPIKKDELVLERFCSKEEEWQVMKSPKDFDADIHSAFLLLPPRFQKSEEKKCEHHWLKRSGKDCYKCGTVKCQAQPLHGKMWCNCDQHLGKPTECPSCFDPSGAGRCGCWKDPVNQKIEQLSEAWRDDENCAPKEYYVKELSALVELARKEKS